MIPARPHEAKALLVIALPLIFAYLTDVLMVVLAAGLLWRQIEHPA